MSSIDNVVSGQSVNFKILEIHKTKFVDLKFQDIDR